MVWMKRNKVRLCKLLVTALVFSLLLNSVHKALAFKYGDGILGLKYLYQLEKNSVDVLVLGSSHAFENVNTGVLYDSYGIAAYTLAGSVQPYWNTYYYLTEALKTQNPKLIVLDALASVSTGEYSDHSRIIKNTLGITDPVTRYEALKVSSPEEEFDNYLLSYRLWHSRYSELGSSDFEEYYQRPAFEYYRGFGINFTTAAQTRPEVDNVTDLTALYEKEEIYLRKIIELCQQEGIPLLLVKSPYILSEEDQKKYNRTEKIAQEYGVEFLNFNSSFYYDSMGLNFETDYADTGHMNYIGNVKYTNMLAKEVLKRYDIPDRREQMEYESWRMHSQDVLGRTENQYLKNEINLTSYLDGLNRERYIVFMVTINMTDRIFAGCEDRLARWGIGEEELKDCCLYVIQNGAVEYQDDGLFWDYFCDLNGHTIKLKQTADTAISHSIMWEGNEKTNGEEKGCYFVIYDSFSEELVQISNFTWNENAVVKQNV